MSSKKEEVLALWSELFVAHPFAVRKVEEQMKGNTPLGLDEYDLLLVVSRQPKHRCKFSQLAEETLYTKSGVTRVAKRMLEKGYLLRENCEIDKRCSYAVLTKLGIEALKETWTIYSKAIVTVMEPCFNIEQTVQLRRLLGQLVDFLKDNQIVQLPSKKG